MASNLTAADKVAYKQMFDAADADKDGKIEFSEFDELVNFLSGEKYEADALRDIFDRVDTNRNNKIEFEEFLKIVPEKPSVSKIYKKEFEKIDLNKNGEITTQELQYGLMNMSKFLRSSDVEALIKTVDVNADGKLNFSEFLGLVEKLYK